MGLSFHRLYFLLLFLKVSSLRHTFLNGKTDIIDIRSGHTAWKPCLNMVYTYHFFEVEMDYEEAEGHFIG